MHQNHDSPRCKAQLVCSPVLWAIIAPAWAQTPDAGLSPPASRGEAAADETLLEEVTVTGSRLRRSGVETPTPTTIVDSETIRASGVTEIADLINQVPSLFVTQTNQTANLAGHAGLNALDLRGLGTERTLVLVNGRRHVPGVPGTSAVDVSTIPVNLIERVEVITGGASALYGADAVAGVTNFILKENFQGLEMSTRYGASTRGDLESTDFDVLFGRNFAEGRGNLTLFGYYGRQPGTVSGEDRPWTARGYPIYVRGGDGKFFVRDGNRALYDQRNGAVVLLGGTPYTFSDNGAPRPLQLGPSGILDAGRYDLNDPFNVGLLLTDGGELAGRYDNWLLQVPTERASTHGTVRYDLNDNIEAFATLEYARSESQSRSAAWKSYGFDVLPADSPFITDELRALGGGTLYGPLPFTRSYDELGASRTHYERELYQVVAGLEGELADWFAGGWRWSAHYSFGQTQEEVAVRNSTGAGRYYSALDAVRAPDGQIVCRSTLSDPTDGCVPFNPLARLTRQSIDYLQFDASPAANTLKQHVVSGYLTGDLLTLPAGPLQAAVGVEFRSESNYIGASPEFNPEHAAFDSSLGITEIPLSGKYDVTEAFGEVRLPLLMHKPFFETLALEGAVRLADYSIAGTETSYKLASEWAPIRDVRFRATYAQAVRAPNISEVFTQSSVAGQWITDPCNSYNVQFRATRTEYTAANCAAIAPGDTGTYWLYRDIVSTGNEELNVETAKTVTLGVAIAPRFIPNLALTADYFDIDLSDAIDAFPAQTLLEKCVDAPTRDNAFCGFVRRDGSNNIDSVVTQQLNLANFRTRGLDLEANYHFALGSRGGRVSINAIYTQLISRNFTLDPSNPSDVDRTAGTFGSPEWKGAVRTGYENGRFSFNWSLRHFSAMRPSTNVEPQTHTPARTSDVFYNDFSAAFWLTPRVSVFGGLANAFDKEPPRLPGAEAGGANFEFGYQSGVYDVIGRTFYVGLRYVP